MSENNQNGEMLFKHYQDIDSTIQSYRLLGAKVVAFASAISIGLLSLAIKEGDGKLFHVLPFLQYMILFYWLNIKSHISSLLGYKHHLESLLLQLNEERIISYSIGKIEEKRPKLAYMFLVIMYGIALLSSIATSLYYSKSNSTLFTILVAANASLYLGLVASYILIARYKSTVISNTTNQRYNQIVNSDILY